MCGRYAINQNGNDLSLWFGVGWLGEAAPLPRYNIAPQTEAPVLRTRSDGTCVLDSLRWGLVPAWAADTTIGRRLVNARAEGAATSGAFRAALKQRRCIVPASGFFEWSGAARRKVPHWVYPEEPGLICMAGLWESWRPAPDAPPLRTFVVLTTASNPDVAPLHDRMPVLIRAEDRDAWLSPTTPADTVARLLASPPAGTLRSHVVSDAVNRVASDGPHLLDPAEDEAPRLPL